MRIRRGLQQALGRGTLDYRPGGGSMQRSREYSQCFRGLMVLAVGLICVLALGPVPAAGECPEEPPLQNYTGSGTVVCPCFVAGEEAGAVLTAPSEHYPIEILRVGIGWGSYYGGTGYSLEQAIHIYGAGLPDPGSPVFSLDGPQLLDGYINEFDLQLLPGEIIIDSGPFTVTLEFMNPNAGDVYAPSMIHDGNGCQAGKNVVYAIPGGWLSACALGVTGDWIVYAVYRQVNCESGVPEELVTSNMPAALLGPQPNPFSHETRIEYMLTEPGHVNLSVYNVHGQKVATLIDEFVEAGLHAETWLGDREDGSILPSGVYFARLEAGPCFSTRRLVLSR
jgi:hypothetical protein